MFLSLCFGLFVTFLVVGVDEGNLSFSSHLALSESRVVLIVG